MHSCCLLHSLNSGFLYLAHQTEKLKNFLSTAIAGHNSVNSFPPYTCTHFNYLYQRSGIDDFFLIVLHPSLCARSRHLTSIVDVTISFLYFQGRTALWDSISLLCHRIKVGYGGIVRGMHLGSSALNILPVLDPENED